MGCANTKPTKEGSVTDGSLANGGDGYTAGSVKVLTRPEMRFPDDPSFNGKANKRGAADQ
jgi:hypothetical protein